jgi:nucleoside-diphosphate-sugar epimerase
MRVFVSGASGYVGGGIARHLAARGHEVLGGIRRPRQLPENVTPFLTGDLAESAPDLSGVDAVVHAAGLAHIRNAPPEAWDRANVQAAETVAKAALAAGVGRFVLISSIGVLGRALPGMADETTLSNPADTYANSKLTTEIRLRALLGERLCVLRPAAVVGPGCPGNIPLLLKLLHHSVPLPFASIRNARSFIALEDLARLAELALAPQTPPLLLAAHPEPISTPSLIRALAEGMGMAPRLFPFPPALLGLAAQITGRGAMWQSLAGSFTVTPHAALAMGWKPAQTLAETLRATSRYYNTTHKTP